MLYLDDDGGEIVRIDADVVDDGERLATRAEFL
jgi:hypothetical protein